MSTSKYPGVRANLGGYVCLRHVLVWRRVTLAPGSWNLLYVIPIWTIYPCLRRIGLRRIGLIGRGGGKRHWTALASRST